MPETKTTSRSANNSIKKVSKKTSESKTPPISLNLEIKKPKTSNFSRQKNTTNKSSATSKTNAQKKINELKLIEGKNILKFVIVLILSGIVISNLILSIYQFILLNSYIRLNESNMEKQKAEISSLKSPNPQPLPNPQPAVATPVEVSKPNPETDKWYGNKNSRFVWIEYSDFQCPFCQKIHPDLKQLADSNPDLAWVYRHYPLTQIHPFAVKLSEASECIFEKEGADKFWKFSELIFANQKQINSQQAVSDLMQSFNATPSSVACFESGELASKVTSQSKEAQDVLGSNGLGTPTGIIYDTQTGKQEVVSGALPLPQLQSSFDNFKNSLK